MKIFTTIFTLLCAVSMFAQMSGEYTIDPRYNTKKTNFNSVSEATQALKYQGIDGDVVFKIANNTYFEPIVADNINPEGNFKVTFESEGDQKVTFANDGLALLVVNSNNLEFNNINFESVSASASNVVTLNNSNNVTVSSCNIITKDFSNKDKYLVNINNTSKNNVFVDNMMIGYNGILISKLSNNNAIESNYLYFDNIGVKIESSQSTNISANTLKGNLGLAKKAVVLDGYSGHIEVASNSFSNVMVGIAQEVTWRPSDQKLSGKIINNVIECKETAIYLTNNVEGLKIDFNSFSTENGSVILLSEEIKNTMTGIEVVANNLISNNTATLVSVGRKEMLGLVDYNNLYNHSKEFKVNVAGELLTSIDTWKEKIGAKNSISADPKYVEIGNAKYLVAEDSPCIDAGPNAINIGVITDYDGDLRGEVTEIGADEFNKIALDDIKRAIEFAFAD